MVPWIPLAAILLAQRLWASGVLINIDRKEIPARGPEVEGEDAEGEEADAGVRFYEGDVDEETPGDRERKPAATDTTATGANPSGGTSLKPKDPLKRHDTKEKRALSPTGPTTKVTGNPSSSGPSPQSPANIKQRSGETYKKALRMGQNLKTGLPPEDSGKEEPVAGGASATAGPPLKALSPGNPAGKEDLVLASVAGFSGAFEALGLRVGRGPSGESMILGPHGREASPAELERLKAKIRSEPEALMKRPDFFEVIPRAHFDGLKQDFAAGAGADRGAFRHVSTTPSDRDFVHSESCEHLSGECNPLVLEPSYRVGNYVSPGSLESIWQGIHASVIDPMDFAKGQAGAGDDRNRKLWGSLSGKLAARFGALASAFGGNAAPGDSAAYVSLGSGSPREGSGSSKSPSLAKPRKNQAPPGAPPRPASAAKPSLSWPWILALAAGAAAVLWPALRRR